MTNEGRIHFLEQMYAELNKEYWKNRYSVDFDSKLNDDLSGAMGHIDELKRILEEIETREYYGE